jgi:hypothetical protein
LSLIVRNSAYSNGTNYFIPSPLNLVGPINLVSSPITNHPWANFSF